MDESSSEPKNSRAGRASTRSRDRARELDVLVVQIARMMIDGAWSHEAKCALATREGVQVATVEEWSADAGRMLRVGPDVETYRAINLRRLDETYSRAEPKVAVAAVAEQNRMLGLHAPERMHVTVQAYAELDDATMLARVEEQIAELTQLRAKLMGKMRVVDMPVPALPAKGGGDDD
jgi:hypothetical protein